MPLITTMRFPRTTGVPEDDVIHTWNWSGTAASTEAGALEALDRLGDFYSVTPGTAPGAAADFMSPVLDYSALSFRAYDSADPEPRTPIVAVDNISIAAPVAQGLPSELACCLSYRAANVSGSPPARRRGRVYIGPLNIDAIGNEDGPPGDIGVSADLRDTLVACAVRLVDLNDGALDWSVWSRADGVFRPVVAGWIDNTFDVQRRRGSDPSFRSSWSATA